MSGGYDYELVEDVKQDFYCVICLNLMKDAMQLECGHGMCNFCLQKLVKSSKDRNVELLCPSCRGLVNENKIHPVMMINRIILSLKIKCSNHVKGCIWIGEIGDLNTHENLCGFQEIECSFNDCNATLPRNVIKEHEEKCELRSIQCAYCSEEFIYKNIPVHLKECIMYPVLCSNGCGMMSARALIQEHLQICPFTITECSYSGSGCQEKIPRRNIDEHNNVFMEKHLMLTSKDLKKLEEEIKNNNVALSLKIDDFEKHMMITSKELKLTNEKLKEANSELAMMKNTNVLLSEKVEEFEKATVKLPENPFVDLLLTHFKKVLSSEHQRLLGAIVDKIQPSLCIWMLIRKSLSRHLVDNKCKQVVMQLMDDLISPDFVTDFVKDLEEGKGILPLTNEFLVSWNESAKKIFLQRVSLLMVIDRMELMHDICAGYNELDNALAEYCYQLCLEKNPFVTTWNGYFLLLKKNQVSRTGAIALNCLNVSLTLSENNELLITGEFTAICLINFRNDSHKIIATNSPFYSVVEGVHFDDLEGKGFVKNGYLLVQVTDT